MRTVSRVPLLFGLAKTMIRGGIRGGYRLLEMTERLGILNVIVRYQLKHGVAFSVPLFRPDNSWDLYDVETYELLLINAFCRKLEPLLNVTLFDCGADIGIFSALVCSRLPHIARVIAFEPNTEVAELLNLNLAHLKVPAEAIIKAVSCVEGAGRLESPKYDASDHARFLLPGDGSLEVVTVDSLGVRNGNIALKIDVEGGELEVLKGAAQTISSASECVITVEAHPKVVNRSGRDPVECLRFLESLRPFNFLIAETGLCPSTSSRLISDDQTAVFNVVGWTQLIRPSIESD